MKKFVIAAMLTLGSSPLLAQAVSPAGTGAMSSADVGIAPLAAQSGPNYVLAASDANQYQVKAAQLAITRAQRDDVKAYAKRVLSEAQNNQRSLMASLKNDQRTIKSPPTSLSSDRGALVKLLEKAPKSAFDNLYLTQSAQVQQAAWAVHKGYAQDGTDNALQQVAGTAVPVLEQELTAGKALLPNGLAGGQ
jgi:putative membrane protein